MAESIREMFWMQDGGWKRTLYVSPAYEEVWGRTCQSLYENPRSWIDTVHPDDREEVMVRLEQQLRGMSTDTEFRVARPDGTLRWVRCHAFPIKDHTGEVYRVAGLAEDITERKQAQGVLRESEERFRGTFENAAVGNLTVSLQHDAAGQPAYCIVIAQNLGAQAAGGGVEAGPPLELAVRGSNVAVWE